MKNNQWKNTTGKQTVEQVFIQIAPQESKTKKEVKPGKEVLLSLGRRFSFDDNGGGYRGL